MFYTKAEALAAACDCLRYESWTGAPGLRGSYEDLSHSPEALAALVADGIEGEKLFTRTLEGIALSERYVADEVFRSHVLALAPLLKTPPFAIRELGYDAASALKYDYGVQGEDE